MNHESRIKQLEKELSELKQMLKAKGLTDEFVPVAIAARQLHINPWNIKSKIKDGYAQYNKHYIKNGNRYLINVKEWNHLMIAVDKAKHL